LKGDTGPQGPKGDTGPAGAQGLKGDTGPQGLKGDTGPAGATGAKGDTGAAGATGATGATGPAGLVWHGAFSAVTQYLPHDAVSFNGSSYVALVAVIGSAPPGASWQLLSSKGDTGATGAPGADGKGLNWRGAFSCAATYAQGDAVSFQGSSYIASAAVGGCTQPPAAPWNVLASKGDQGPKGVTGATGPTGPAGPQGPAGGPAGFFASVVGPTTIASGTPTRLADLTVPSGSYLVTESFNAVNDSTTAEAPLRCTITTDDVTATRLVLHASDGTTASSGVVATTVEGQMSGSGTIHLDCSVDGAPTATATDVHFAAVRLASVTAQ